MLGSSSTTSMWSILSSCLRGAGHLHICASTAQSPRSRPRQHIPLQKSLVSTHRHYIAPLKWSSQMAIILIQELYHVDFPVSVSGSLPWPGRARHGGVRGDWFRHARGRWSSACCDDPNRKKAGPRNKAAPRNKLGTRNIKPCVCADSDRPCRPHDPHPSEPAPHP